MFYREFVPFVFLLVIHSYGRKKELQLKESVLWASRGLQCESKTYKPKGS